MVLGCAGLSLYPLFLSEHWFEPSNASALRGKLRALILELFLDQAADKNTAAVAEAVAEIAAYDEDTATKYSPHFTPVKCRAGTAWPLVNARKGHSCCICSDDSMSTV